VKRAVWARDSGRCTFVSETGRRCPARKCLEFDHVDEVARGGEASIAGIRLRCRAHNQYQAECTFGAGFMEQKREEARRTAEERRQAAAAAAADAEARRQAAATAAAAAAERAREVIPWLKRLGFRDNEIRRAVALCSTSPEATLEERVRLALLHLGPVGRHVSVS
jgi:DNA-binding transcriptional MerR regulator